MSKNLNALLRYAVVPVALLVLAAAAPPSAAAQSVATSYERLLSREKAARASQTPSLATLRTIAKSYESLTRAHPTSGYADNALWQAAGVMAFVYERSGERTDWDQAARLLGWLKKEYPGGSLAKQVDARLVALGPPAKPVAKPPAASPTVTTATTTTKTTTTAAPASAAPPSLTPPASAASPSSRPPAPASATPLPATAAAVKQPAVAIKGITHSTLPRGDRLTVELSNETIYTASRTSNPDRVTVDLSNAQPSATMGDGVAEFSSPLLKSLTVNKPAGGSTRLILELSGRPRYSTFPLYNPFRLVIDIENESLALATVPPVVASVAAKPSVTDTLARRTPQAPLAPSTTPAAASETAPPPPSPASTSKGEYSLARQLGLGVSRIVIDPGHGGHDPGAQSNGINEADLVLDVAQRLETLLKAQSGVDVVLTRRTDEFIPLEERTAMANREKADMFVSIHANASPRPAARGVETYFLNFASNPEAEALAARENASSAQTMRELPQIVKAIALTNKLDESHELAQMVQTSLVKKLDPQSKGLKDLGVKRAPFVVLIGAQMPSVLAEISFITNRTDASLLRQATYRQRIAQALADAVLKYRTSLKGLPTVATKTAARQGE